MTDVEAAAVLTPPSDTTTVDTALITESPEHWPALSESVRNSAKSALPDSLKALSIGSPNPSAQGKDSKEVGIESEASGNSMPKPNPPPQSPTSVVANRQNSVNRVGGNSGRNNNKGYNSKFVDGGMAQVQSAPGSPSVLSNSGSSSSVGETSVDSSRKNAGQRNEQHPFRRSHSGPLSRGDNRTNTREPDRRRREFGSRSFGSRENHSQQPTVYRPPSTRGPSPPPYVPYQVHPAAFPAYSPPMVYHAQHMFLMGHHPDFQQPQVTMIPQMPFPVPDPDLSSQILKQIEYYFSDDNLVKDWFLRTQMDGEGWVPISLVAGFRKVTELTGNIQLIMEALRSSNAVEVQGDRLRRKTDWVRWIPRPELSKAT